MGRAGSTGTCSRCGSVRRGRASGRSSRSASNAKELAGQHRGDHVAARPSKLHGFWVPDDEGAAGAGIAARTVRTSTSSETRTTRSSPRHGVDGRPTGSKIADDMAANAQFFKKVRFGLHGELLPTRREAVARRFGTDPPTTAIFLIARTPRWFHRRCRSCGARRPSSTT